MAELVASKDAEGRSKQRPFSFVPEVTMLGLPGHERCPAFGQIEDSTARLFPSLGPIVLFQRSKSRLLGVAEALHRGMVFMTIPAPGGSFNAGGGQHSGVIEQAV
jgi:hypothetical protein